MKTMLPLMLMLILMGCAQEPKSDVQALIATDESFSRMSVEKGLNAAFIFYAADSVVKLRDGDFPIIGKSEMTRIYTARPDSEMILQWRPVKAETGRSNDLGYTFGEWELYLKSKDTTMYGNYISIWRKQPDGTWKYVVDAGCNTPKRKVQSAK